MLEAMNVEFMRARHHGTASTLQLVQEDSGHFYILGTLTSNFVLTRKWDVAQGAYVDRLTIKFVGTGATAALAKFRLTDVINLTVGAVQTRYRLENRQDTRQLTSSFGFADCAMIKNEKTAIVARPTP